MIDTLPLWFFIPAAIVGWSWLIIHWFRSIPRGSQLDRLDGLDSRTD